MDGIVLQIYDLLYRLGVTARYIGFFHISYAVRLCAEQPERLLLVTKWVYPDVAKRYNTTWQAVARDISTVSRVIWEANRPLLERMARRHLTRRPENAQLLAILVASLVSHDPDPLAIHGLGEPVALPGKDDDMGVMDEPVYEGGRETVVAEDGVPLAEFQVGGDNEAPAFIAV